jgi:hypothetical protein
VRQRPAKDGYTVYTNTGMAYEYPMTEVQSRVFSYGLAGLIIGSPWYAEGEIYARTERTLSVVFPATWQSKVMKKNQIRKCSLIIGKNRINLYNDSGISYQRCGKMYKQTYVTLPGGFVLPISIVSETWSICDFNDIVVEPNVAKETLSMYADSYLLKEMVAGKILATDESFSDSGTVYQIIGDYACLEMIGQTRKEEIYGKYD